MPPRSGNGNLVTWQHDGNYYQFWNDGTEDGKFTITNVRPGTYTLHAFADGVLGEFAQTNITVEAGKKLDLGKLDWKPVRYGKQVWEIGYPDRTGGKFFKGDGATTGSGAGACAMRCCSPTTSPTPSARAITTRTGSSRKCRMATSTAWLNPAAKDPANQRFGWVKAATGGEDMWRTIGRGRATTWTIKFNMDKAAQGKATLRVALAGADGSGGLAVAVNGKSVGTIRTVATNALRYNTDKGRLA